MKVIVKDKDYTKNILLDVINKLNEIEGQLDDAYYSLPEYNSNVDSRGSIDGARSDLYCLKDIVEKNLENERF
tara:strand:+ start:328 stop:546 length:219 start_codon:yes stop_codon:yes gene_type:complete